MTKVLVYCPTWKDDEGKLAVRDETRQAIDQLGAKRIVYGTVNPYPGYDFRNVTAQYLAAWKLAIDGKYDFLLTVEHDIIPPANTLQRLWECDAGVVFGIYTFRRNPGRASVVNAYRWVDGIDKPDMSISLFPKALEQAREKNIVRVSGVGFGCTLIKREVLQKIEPRGDRDTDLNFATDCIRANIPMLARFDVICGHIHEGKIQRPFEGMASCAILALATFHGATPNGSKYYEKGKTYKAPLVSVEQWEKAGFVRRLEN
jgi:hypothetical protein